MNNETKKPLDEVDLALIESRLHRGDFMTDVCLPATVRLLSDLRNARRILRAVQADVLEWHDCGDALCSHRSQVAAAVAAFLGPGGGDVGA